MLSQRFGDVGPYTLPKAKAKGIEVVSYKAQPTSLINQFGTLTSIHPMSNTLI